MEAYFRATRANGVNIKIELFKDSLGIPVMPCVSDIFIYNNSRYLVKSVEWTWNEEDTVVDVYGIPLP